MKATVRHIHSSKKTLFSAVCRVPVLTIACAAQIFITKGLTNLLQFTCGILHAESILPQFLQVTRGFTAKLHSYSSLSKATLPLYTLHFKMKVLYVLSTKRLHLCWPGHPVICAHKRVRFAFTISSKVLKFFCFPLLLPQFRWLHHRHVVPNPSCDHCKLANANHLGLFHFHQAWCISRRLKLPASNHCCLRQFQSAF